MNDAPDDAYCDVRWTDGDSPSVRYASGLFLYDEALVAGRLLARYWSPVGRPDLNPAMNFHGIVRPGVEYSAFQLAIDGQSLHRGWELAGRETEPGERPGQQHATLTLKSRVRPITVRVHTVLDGTAVMTRWLEITNEGGRPAALSHAAVWSGRVFPAQLGDASYGDPADYYSAAHGDYEIGYFVESEHVTEGHFQWHALGDLPVEVRGRSGQSGHGHPILYLRDGKAGHVFVAQLAWSGNWTMRVERHGERVHMAAGPSAAGPMRVIEPGETIATPPVHVGGVAGDLSDLVQHLHEHQRRSVLVPPPDGCANLVSYNHWSYTTHEMSEAKLLAEIDIAADIGAEVFTVDAGWYGDPGVSWSEQTGVWRPGGRLPNGLGPVFEHARSKGLRCGLWVWIEAASKTSEIIKQHPDWLLERDGERLDNQLDLTKAEVAEWVESEIVRIVEEYGIDLFRLDYNARPGEGGYSRRHGYDENTIWRHYEAMYGIWERVRARFPNLIIENCAGGGGRTDLGMLSRLHFTWFSDFVVAPRTIRMQNAMMLALPPEVLARCAGVIMNGHVGGDLDLQLRMNVLLGNPCLSGLWPTLDEKNLVAERCVRRAVAFFKDHVRPMIATCRVFHHTPVVVGSQPEGWCVFEYASPDASKAIAGLFRLAGEAEAAYELRFRGLSRETVYDVWFANADETVSVPGRELIERGVRVLLPHPMTSELVMATASKA